MPDTINLVDGTTITRADALDAGQNVLVRHAQFNAQLALYMSVWEHRSAAAALVAKHIHLAPDRVEMAHPKTWMRGSFNLVVPMLVNNTSDAEAEAYKVLLRLPMPAKFGEAHHPGTVADKLRCETAAYIYMQRHCPDVRVPQLYGFGFPGEAGVHFSHASRLSIVRRAALYIRQRIASALGWPVPSAYVPIRLTVPVPPPLAQTGYLVLEFLDEGRFGRQVPHVLPCGLSLSELHAQEPAKTRNLCSGLARIMLALARVPQPRIGAYRFCLADGSIRLDGRPVPCDLAMLEAEGLPRTIGLDTTYTDTARYVADLARFQESAFRTGPNMTFSRSDAEEQMAVMVMMRAAAHQFVKAEDSEGDGGNGPFVLHLSDGTPGNILIDGDWHVTALFDLEWLFAAPVGQLHAPLWLTNQFVDIVADDGYDTYCASRDIYMDIFREEERKQTGSMALSDAIDVSWTSQRTWFYIALSSILGMVPVVQSRLEPLFWPDMAAARRATVGKTKEWGVRLVSYKDEDSSADSESPKQARRVLYKALCSLWQPDAQAVVTKKMKEREHYKVAVEKLFQDEST